MNKKAEQLIIDAGEKVLAYLEATEEFAVEQAPLLAQEIVAWGVWRNGLVVLGGIASIVASIPLLKIATTKLFGDDVSEKEFSKFITSLAAGFGCLLFGLICALKHVDPFLKAIIVPRLYIIEQIGGLLG